MRGRIERAWRRCGEVKRSGKDTRRITKYRQPRRSPHFTLFVPTCSATLLTPTLALSTTDPAERDALRERYAAKLAAFSTSVQDDESLLSGKRHSFRLFFFTARRPRGVSNFNATHCATNAQLTVLLKSCHRNPRQSCVEDAAPHRVSLAPQACAPADN